MSKPLRLRAAADRDASATVAYYQIEAGDMIARQFTMALAVAYDAIAEHPALGSLRYAAILGVAGLRCWPVPRYPYLVFYVERADFVEVVRVLHTRRDIPAQLSEEN